MRSFSLLFVMSLSFAGCAPGPAAEDVGRAQSAIAGGDPASDPAVVLISLSDGTFCTGAVIADRVVLSAKHCVQKPTEDLPEPVEAFTVGVGDGFDGLSSSHAVVEIFAPAGHYDPGGPTGIGVGIEGDDVALLVLADSLTVTPVAVRTTAPSDLSGATVRAVGFGVTPGGTSGAKLAATTTVSEVRDRTLVAGPITCSGDSGGPLFDAGGEVVGVTSYSLGACGLGTSYFNRLDVHADLIAAALAAAGACTPTGAERCNAVDDDCNGMVDEGCTALGAPCSFADECVGGGICTETPGGQVCSVRCDPRRPTLGCGPGLYCARGIGCDGFCVSGSAGSGADGANCSADTDCASLTCIDPGDGRRRCGAPCESDRGMCTGGQLCAAPPVSCGGCVSDGWSGPRGLGEPCSIDSECLSLFCGLDGGAQYCSRFCDADDVCGEGYHCREGECVLGPRAAAGESCLLDADCREGLACLVVGDASVCAEACATDPDCADGFTCEPTDDGNACLPTRGLLGEACESGEGCVSGLCADTGDGRVCTRECSEVAACPPTFACVAPDDGSTSVCVRLPDAPPPDADGEGGGGGCSTGGAPSESGWPAALVVFLLLSFNSRRRDGR